MAQRQQLQQQRFDLEKQRLEFQRQRLQQQQQQALITPGAPPSTIVSQPQLPTMSPAAPPPSSEQDLRPAQEAADPTPAPAAPPSGLGKKVLIGVLIAGAAIGTVVVVKKIRARKKHRTAYQD